jgi:23S rRNA (pseudouridine1915-N3)-methyltransferase
MHFLLASVATRRLTGPAFDLTQFYVDRIAHYAPCTHRIFAAESKLLQFLSETAARTRPALFLTESRGQQASSEEIADQIGGFQDNGTQLLVMAVGPADGWSPLALQRADRTLAFGRITLPHELAAVVAAEQMYRALTIRAGHPYHSGHAR